MSILRLPVGGNIYLARTAGDRRQLLSRDEREGVQSDSPSRLVGQIVEWEGKGRAILTNQLLIRLTVPYSLELADRLGQDLPLTGMWPIAGLPELAVARFNADLEMAPAEVLLLIRSHQLVVSADFDLVAFSPAKEPNEEPTHLARLESAQPTQWQWTANGINTTGLTQNGTNIKIGIIDIGYNDQIPSALPFRSRHRFNNMAQPVTPVASTSSLWIYGEREHGTYCAGLAAARSTVFGRGAAPGAELVLIGIDVVSPSTMVAAFQACIANQVQVVSCSLFPFDHNQQSSWTELNTEVSMILTRAATTLRADLGIPIFWASCNRDASVSINLLADHPHAIAMGGHNANGGRIPGGQGSKLEFLGPGEVVPGLGETGGIYSPSGTSCAAPCAAGVAALLLQERPQATAAQILQACRAGCRRPAGVVGRTDKEGWGNLDAQRALAELKRILP